MILASFSANYLKIRARIFSHFLPIYLENSIIVSIFAA
jgi:hypothetical protein